MLTRNAVILVKLESTYKTDPTPSAATDAVLAENPVLSSSGLMMVPREGVRGSLATQQQIYAGRLGELSFDVEVKGSGTAGTEPAFDALNECCGLISTVVASTSVTYEFDSDVSKSCTIYFYQDGVLTTLNGCVGNVSFKLEAGGIVKASYTMTGHVNARTDTSIVTPTLETTVPEPCVGIGFTVGGYSAVISSWSVDLGNTIALSKSANSTDGYGQLVITRRDVNGTIDPEDVLVGTNDWYGDFVAGSTMAMSIGPIGSTAGNILDIDLPVTYFRDLSQGDRDGILTLDASYAADESSGDDELSIAFT